MGNGDLKVKITNLQQDTASILKLLGGPEDDRLRFWEIMKGITTPAVMRVVETQVDALQQQVKSVHHVLKTLETNARELGSEGLKKSA